MMNCSLNKGIEGAVKLNKRYGHGRVSKELKIEFNQITKS